MRTLTARLPALVALLAATGLFAVASMLAGEDDALQPVLAGKALPLRAGDGQTRESDEQSLEDQAELSDDESTSDKQPSDEPDVLAPLQEVQPAVLLDPKLAALRDRCRRIIAHYEQGRLKLNSRDHTAWEGMHAIVAYGVKTMIRDGGPQGEEQTAVGWLCFNRPMKGFQILTLYNGKPLGVRGYGVEGHHGQLLAILAQGRLTPDYPVRVGGKEFTLEDLIENEKLTCRPNEELTFKLIGLSYYLPSDATWKSYDGQDWSIPRLIREEIRQPIQGAACGGTHRLMGLSYAFTRREKQGLPIDGEFARARKYIREYQEYAFTIGNPDGSFSTQWLEFKQDRSSIDRRIQTSGHILEWLAYSLSDEQLLEPRMVKSVDYLSRVLEQNRDHAWEIGPLSHAVHSLILYDRRVFQQRQAKESGGSRR